MTAALARLVPVASPTALAGDEPPARELALLEAAQAGDRTAFGDLIGLHEQAVFRTALAALGAREEAEDAAQDAFVVAWQKLASFRRQSSFRTWLLTITWRKALDRRRRQRLWWSRIASSPAADPAPVDLIEALDASPEYRAVSRDLVERARREIRRLSPKLRDALLLACSGAHTYAEISAMLRIPVGTVKWRVSEARRILLARLPEASAARGDA